ncbi:MAG: hypothetical protein RBT46_05390, partial [Weeksellaceae bacterium]|nr:hypothetical protein [Weeksellaceae bacterium]
MKKITQAIIKIIALIIYPFFIIYKIISTQIGERIYTQLIRYNLQFNGHQIGNSLKVGKSVKFKIHKNSKVSIGKNVVIGDDVYIKVKKRAELIIGDNVHINKGTRISSFESIKINKNTLIASYCNLLDHNHLYTLLSPPSTKEYECSPIYIEEGVLLGTKVQVN